MKKPILVTGSHRSGSTWIGKMISESPEVGYIHEPFNLSIKRYNQPFDHWFEFISEFCSQNHQDKVLAYMQSFTGMPSGVALVRLFKVKNFYDFYFYLRDTGNLKRRLFQRTLFKDPIAIMSTEWLYEKLGCDVIITVRHPAAFIASLKLKKWEFDFNNFLEQSNLMRVHLSSQREVIADYSAKSPDIIHQGIALWNAINSVVLSYREKYNDQWLFVRHEDISLHPMDEYKRIFSFLNIPFTERVKNAIVKSTTAEDSGKHKRDSVKNISTWQDRLSSEEITLIRNGTREVWKHFYSEEDW